MLFNLLQTGPKGSHNSPIMTASIPELMGCFFVCCEAKTQSLCSHYDFILTAFQPVIEVFLSRTFLLHYGAKIQSFRSQNEFILTSFFRSTFVKSQFTTPYAVSKSSLQANIPASSSIFSLFSSIKEQISRYGSLNPSLSWRAKR